MATKKKTKPANEPIVGPGKSPEAKLTVQKSLPLFSLWRSNMSLPEFKILDTYLSRINSHDPDHRTVVFTKGEIEGLLGVTQIKKKDLSSRLKSLARSVDIELDNEERIHQISLFEEVDGFLDEGGQWTISLTCSNAAMKYIFNIDQIGYLRYKLRSITSIVSRYTYILFTYLESNRFRKSWEVPVDDLRMILNCDQDESYAQFKVFNDRILKRCQSELHEKTECRFSYETIKRGRKVVALRFTLETLSDKIDPQLAQPEEDDAQQSLFLRSQHSYSDPRYEALAAACKYEFDEQAMEVISEAVNERLLHETWYFYIKEKDTREEEKYKVLAECYRRLKQRAVSTKIPNRFEYLLTIIKNF